MRSLKLKKALVIGFLLILGIFILTSFQSIFYSKRYAQTVAEGKFRSYCLRNELDPEQFDGPVEIPMNVRWSFGWEHKVKKDFVVGVWLHVDGYPEIYSNLSESGF